MNPFLERLYSAFPLEQIVNDVASRYLPSLLVALVTLAGFLLFWKILQRTALAVLRGAALDETAQQFIIAVLRYALLTIAAVTALGQLGVNMTSILTSMGVVGLTVGFAAKDALSNVISGLFIFWDRPFVIGDLIEITGHYGRVDAITMRSTRVVTVDGKMLAIPNSEVVNTTVASYTNFPHLRLDIDVSISVNEDIDRVRKVLLDLVVGKPHFMTDPEPGVVVTSLNDYNNVVQLRVWLEDERDHISRRFELREKAYKALIMAGVDMPLETLALAPLSITTHPA